jgi:threonine aldolase
MLAQGLASTAGVLCAVGAVETNIVNFDLPGCDAARFAVAAASLGVRVNATGPERIRAVTHLGVDAEDIERALERLQQALRAP